MSDHYSHYIGALQAQPVPLKVVPVPGDGNCLFRSVAHQVYGDYDLHSIVRQVRVRVRQVSFNHNSNCNTSSNTYVTLSQRCMDYMEADGGFFSQFVEGGMEAFPFYLRAKRLNACWGDDPEIQAICELYGRPAEIWLGLELGLGLRSA
jgi:OTU domain-containing protein 5